MTSYGELKTMNKNVFRSTGFPAGRWTFLELFGFGLRKRFTTEEESPIDDHHIQRKRTPSSEPRVHCPEKRSEVKEDFFADEGTIETVFRTIISVNQLSIYGAISDLMKRDSAEQERGDLHLQSNLTDCLSEQDCWKTVLILRKKISCKCT